MWCPGVVCGVRRRLPACLLSGGLLPFRGGGVAWRASLAPLAPDILSAAWSAVASHLSPVVLGGFAQHCVGREPTRSAQEACHGRTVQEYPNSLHVHVFV